MTTTDLRRFGSLAVVVHPDAGNMGRAAADDAAIVVRTAIAERGRARAVFAAANSQLPLFATPQRRTDVDWPRFEATIREYGERLAGEPLDPTSRKQQVGEGHFAGLAALPTHALTLTIPALLAARRIVVVVPDAHKADAVAAALLGPIATSCPASVRRTVEHSTLHLDPSSARRLARPLGRERPRRSRSIEGGGPTLTPQAAS